MKVVKKSVKVPVAANVPLNDVIRSVLDSMPSSRFGGQSHEYIAGETDDVEVYLSGKLVNPSSIKVRFIPHPSEREERFEEIDNE